MLTITNLWLKSLDIIIAKSFEFIWISYELIPYWKQKNEPLMFIVIFPSCIKWFIKLLQGIKLKVFSLEWQESYKLFKLIYARKQKFTRKVWSL